MAEHHAGRVSTVLAADADLKVRILQPSRIHPHLDQRPHSEKVYRSEGVIGKYALVDIRAEELAFGVVPAESKGHLGQVVGAEAEEIRLLGDLTGGQRGPGRLDHGAEFVMDLDSQTLLHLGRDQAQVLPKPAHLLDIHRQWDHDLRVNVQALFDQEGGRRDYGLHLHPVDGREAQTQPAAPVSQHGIGLPERVHQLQEGLFFLQVRQGRPGVA